MKKKAIYKWVIENDECYPLHFLKTNRSSFMKKFLGLGFLATLVLSLSSCCFDRNPSCEPCSPKPRYCEPRACSPKPVCEPKYFDNSDCY
ncbi:Uncharacterized protein PRO82_001215 [Candidatus Protochlamydia amoebophila]|nr:Uncharacterized protein [Candidatus Protochlamydia amoebophila]